MMHVALPTLALFSRDWLSWSTFSMQAVSAAINLQSGLNASFDRDKTPGITFQWAEGLYLVVDCLHRWDGSAIQARRKHARPRQTTDLLQPWHC